jgi:probable phosphoglycerate mutase
MFCREGTEGSIMTKIYLIRHGEAEGNLYRRAQGQYDSNITALGRRQITALAERFRTVPVDAVWSSDLCRAQSTAAAILKYHPNLTLHTTSRLREVDVGVWEDVPWGSIHRSYPQELDYFTYDPARWSVPEAESYEALVERFRQTVLELAQQYDGQTVAVVAHGLGIRALLCDLLGVTSENIATLPYGDNTSVSLLEVEQGQVTVRWYNDNSHLDETLSTFARQAWWRQQQKQPQGYTHFEPLNLRREGELYSHCYAQTWLCSHGNLHGFSPAVYLHSAQLHENVDARCVEKLYWEDTFAGLVELDPYRGEAEGAGWISLLYIEPELRQKRLGIQLVGHAVSYFRAQGRRCLRLHVSQTNDQALGFYEHNGFVSIEQTQGVGGMLYLMELDIARRVLTPADI